MDWPEGFLGGLEVNDRLCPRMGSGWVVHALAYAWVWEVLRFMSIHHGIGNSIEFEYLEEFYPEGVAIVTKWVEKERHQIFPESNREE